jgi:hypothetical protein
MERRDQQELWNGFGDTLARALEFVLTPLLFGLAGAGLDRVLGTSPIFMIALGALAVVGLALRTYFVYAEEMRAHERRLPGHSGQAQ